MESKDHPKLRTDLDFMPVLQENRQFILIRDHLGLVDEGKAVPIPLYEIMAHLDGNNSIRDIQMFLMQRQGGLLVGTDEIEKILSQLEESFLLDTDKFRRAKEQIEARFAAETVRPCTHGGRSYPADARELEAHLNGFFRNLESSPKPETEVTALVAPHIDFAVGSNTYASAYGWLKHASPSRILILGVGHQLMNHFFCLTTKDFETPFGIAKNDRDGIEMLRGAGKAIISENDFPHRAEHSIEFQVIFLQHLLKTLDFTILPILCGSLRTGPGPVDRNAYLEAAGPFLEVLSALLHEGTLLIAGIDLSHIGPKFGHQMPATSLEGEARSHDRNLLEAVSKMDKEAFWEESERSEGKYNVCGFSALACLLEVLPPSRGKILDYQMWHEQPTRSAVSFAAMVFTENKA